MWACCDGGAGCGSGTDPMAGGGALSGWEGGSDPRQLLVLFSVTGPRATGQREGRQAEAAGPRTRV